MALLARHILCTRTATTTTTAPSTARITSTAATRAPPTRALCTTAARPAAANASPRPIRPLTARVLSAHQNPKVIRAAIIGPHGRPTVFHRVLRKRVVPLIMVSTLTAATGPGGQAQRQRAQRTVLVRDPSSVCVEGDVVRIVAAGVAARAAAAVVGRGGGPAVLDRHGYAVPAGGVEVGMTADLNRSRKAGRSKQVRYALLDVVVPFGGLSVEQRLERRRGGAAPVGEKEKEAGGEDDAREAATLA
ncbi:MAG: hypothetical protein M1826_007728 [Phylliscum demangeonii]|nr:MAG: hypothetical protein M1826_007728 [Phylliscum demangeonii]